MSTPESSNAEEYWKANLRLLAVLLGIWFLVGYVLSIIAVEQLNRIHIAGFPLGFWFAQQGSVYVFIVLIYVYARWMQKIDRQFGVDEGDDS